jgi:hypothetical protein
MTFPASPQYTVWASSTLQGLVQATTAGPTGPSGPSGGGGATGPTGPAGSNRSNANLQLQWVSGAIVTNDTVWFAYSAPFAGTINNLTYFCTTGSFTVNVKIATTSVTGLGAINNNSATPATTSATGANTFTAGQQILAAITSASGSPTDALLTLNVTWA